MEKKRTLLRKIFRTGLFLSIGLIVLLILLIILTPYIAPPIVKSIIKSKIGEYVNGTVELKSCSFSWSGAVHLGEFSITPPSAAEPIISIKDINTKVNLKALLASKLIADVSVDKPIISIIRDKNGKLNIDKLLKETKQSTASYNSIVSTLYAESLPTPLNGRQVVQVQSVIPFIKFNLNVQNGALNITDSLKGNTTQFSNIKLAIIVDTIDNPISFDISADELSSGKQTRTAGLKGQLKITKDNLINLQSATGQITYTIQNLSLENLSAAVSIYLPIDSLSGQVNGQGNYDINGFPSIKGSGQIIMEEVVIESKTLTSEPIKLPRIALISQFTVDATGNGQQEVTFDAGSLLNAGLTTQFTGINGPSANLDSVLKLKSNVKDISQSLRNVLQLKTAYQLEGNLEGQIKAKIVLKEQNIRQADIDGALWINNLNAVSDNGQKTPIEPGINIALKTQLDGDKGTINVSTLQLDTFFMHATGNADITQLQFLPKGISTDNAVIKTNFTVNIGLTELFNKLNSFMTLPPINPAGTIEGALSLSGTTDNVQLNGHLAGKKLSCAIDRGQVSNIPSANNVVNLGPYDISLDSSGMLNMRANANSNINYSMVITDASSTNLIKVNGSETLQNITQGIGNMVCEGKTDILINFKPIVNTVAQFVPALANLNVEGTAATTIKYDFRNNELHIQDEPKVSITSVNGKIGTTPVKAENIEFSGKRDVILNLKDKMAITINELNMTGPGLTLAMQGTVNEILGTPQFNIKLQGKIEPEPLVQKIGALLGGLTISGKPLTMSFELEGTPESLKSSGQAQTAVITGHGSFLGETGLSQTNMKCNYDLTLELKPESINAVIRQMNYQSDTATMSFSGKASLPQNNIALDAKLSVNLDLAKAAHDLAAFINLPPDYSVSGLCTGDMTIKTQNDIISAVGKNNITQFALNGPDKSKSISEPKMDFNYELLLDANKFNFNIKQFELTSGILDGSISGELLNLTQAPELKGIKLSFTYVPDKLGALIQPWLPLRIKGTDKQPLIMNIDGKIQTGADIVASIKHLLLQANMGLSEVTWMGITAQGKFGINLNNERITSDNKLTVNGGTAELKTIVDLRNVSPTVTPAVQSSLDTNASNVRLNQDMGFLLALIPLCKSSKGTVDGFANATFHFDWKGTVDLPAIEKDWISAVSSHASGQGNIAVRDLVITGSALLGDILGKLSGDDSGTARGELKDSKIVVANGRATYKNMTLILNNLQIIVNGWIQLDEKMDMVIKVPITKELANQFKGIDKMVGQQVDVPMKGTITDPKIEWTKTLGDLAKEIAKSGAEDKLKDKLKPKRKRK
ncbi:MAG: hypothetical protein V1871_09675 [Planctomycetota bacterium]